LKTAAKFRTFFRKNVVELAKMTDQFLGLPNAMAEQADVLILPVPHEKTVTYNRGTSAGPKAILAASEQLEFYEEDKCWCPFQYLKVSVLPEIVGSDTDQQFHHDLHETVSLLKQDALFIALGGEHSITPDMVFARMPEGGTVVQIDAHADFRPEYHGSVYNHACPMFRIREKGYSLIQIGIRSLQAFEAEALQDDGQISTWFDRELQKAESWKKLLEQLRSLSGDVYFTIDLDGFDPGLIAGVGTPQPGGLSWHQGLDILECLTDNPNINLRGMDIVELIPEASCVSDMLAAKLVQKMISYWGKAIGADKNQPVGSQQGVEDE
jgi:agmatinase